MFELKNRKFRKISNLILPRKIFFYLSGLFTIRLIVILLFIVFIVTLLELLETSRNKSSIFIRAADQLWLSAMKMPFIIHQTLAFIIFFSALLFVFRLSRHKEIVALRSIGISFMQFMTPVLLISFIIATLDLYILSPVSEKMMREYGATFKSLLGKESSSESAAASNFWKSITTKSGKVFLHIARIKQKGVANDVGIYFFSNSGEFIKSYWAKSAKFKKNSIVVRNCWKIQQNKSPNFMNAGKIKCEFNPIEIVVKKRTAYVGNSSFRDIGREIRKSEYTPAHIVRWHYLLMNAALITLLGPLALLFSISCRGGASALIWNLTGSIACFCLYLQKELMYMFMFNSAKNSFYAMIIWAPVFIAVFLFAILIVEKHEI
ncbi:LptF/LptG family permease [Candidatus Hydrogenosomobacter endosymbioticus]|uniref:LptF/LptG family permease n=1 Tax=Candidatus Hydrogenosomobacter endosymbioticus TaxID=2558174 RepID=UPI001F1E3BC9|nr:LptF/LptG family permease [Candidatus Hydrogenosomobacter endosymbioticus]